MSTPAERLAFIQETARYLEALPVMPKPYSPPILLPLAYGREIPLRLYAAMGELHAELHARNGECGYCRQKRRIREGAEREFEIELEKRRRNRREQEKHRKAKRLAKERRRRELVSKEKSQAVLLTPAMALYALEHFHLVSTKERRRLALQTPAAKARKLRELRVDKAKRVWMNLGRIEPKTRQLVQVGPERGDGLYRYAELEPVTLLDRVGGGSPLATWPAGGCRAFHGLTFTREREAIDFGAAVEAVDNWSWRSLAAVSMPDTAGPVRPKWEAVLEVS